MKSVYIQRKEDFGDAVTVDMSGLKVFVIEERQKKVFAQTVIQMDHVRIIFAVVIQPHRIFG